MLNSFRELNEKLDNVVRTSMVEELRKAYFEAVPEVCAERAQLVTEEHDQRALFDAAKITSLDKAQVYRSVLMRKDTKIWDYYCRKKDGSSHRILAQSLFVGSTTSRFKGVVLYPEYMALALWPELRYLSTRAANPYIIDAETRRELNEEVFPRWMDRSILERARHMPPPAGEDAPDFGLLQYLPLLREVDATTAVHVA